MEQVKRDTTFYKSFKNLRAYAHQVQGEAAAFKISEKERAYMSKSGSQRVENSRTWIEVSDIVERGKLKNRKGEHRHYTMQLFDEVFFSSDTLPVVANIGDYTFEPIDGTQKEKHKNNLKLMMFNPGRAIQGVPLVGKKMAIFDADMIPYYDYKIWKHTYRDSIPCIAFSCRVKRDVKQDKTVVKELVSYFNELTMHVMAREYRLAYQSMLFDFNVKIAVENELRGNTLLPLKVDYQGYWDIPLKKAERISFKIRNSNYEVE